MGRDLSPLLKQEFENLDKDADSRKSAMKAIKSYVKDLDSNAVPIFLAEVSNTKQTGLTSGEYTISLYEVLARVHGLKIVPQIDNIMSTIIKSLASTVASFALQQACSKVVPTIARCAMDPTTPDDKKRRIIHSLCKPLSYSLLSTHESLSSGAALCLKALVDSDNWWVASSHTVNEVCQRVVGALERPMMTSSHMGLVMSLAKHNGLVVEAYARLLVLSGIKILNMPASEGVSQKWLMTIQMINCLMKSLDCKCLMSELRLIIEEMKKCDNDQMAYVKGAAFEATQTARRILTEKGSKLENQSGQRGQTASHESQTMDSFDGYSSVVDSQYSETDCDRSVDRKLWKHENGGEDVSLQHRFFSGVNKSDCENGYSEEQGDYANGFSRFLQKSESRSQTPSPERYGSFISFDNVKIYTTPRKLVKTLQASNAEKQSQIVKSPQSQSSKGPLLVKFGLDRTPKYDQNGCLFDPSDKFDHDDEQFYDTSESVSSSDDDICQELIPETKETCRFSGLRIVRVLIVLFAIIVCLFLVGDADEGHNLVPT
ncbi:protein SINE1-like [Bidens hawaiensis]|uniref:protein SINE1-like n=1 Tax=Bidens hawaiensis TaxID=980011 RepID=UPI00404B5189